MKTPTQDLENKNKKGLNIAEEEQTSLGQIKINQSVIASIVRLSALQVEGVHAVGGGLVDGIAEIFSKKESDRGVRVTEEESGGYFIEVRVVMRFGVELAKVAMQIQEQVTEKVSQMTMKGVSRVDVIIDGVKVATKGDEEKQIGILTSDT
jgi:uncharacterized alkaline shock family protein YloU